MSKELSERILSQFVTGQTFYRKDIVEFLKDWYPGRSEKFYAMNAHSVLNFLERYRAIESKELMGKYLGRKYLVRGFD